MNNLSRHIACKLCRDRKVRCDGGQPSCEKCRRSGESCVYVPTHKPTKADLAQTIESLQERLDKAEAYISRSSNVVVKPITSDPLGTPNSLCIDYSDCAPFNMAPMPTPTGSEHFLTPNVSGTSTPHYPQHTFPITPEHMDGDYISYLPSPHMTPPYQGDAFYGGDMHMPNIREIRALNSSSHSPTPPPPSPNMNTQQRTEDVSRLLAQVQAFGLSVFNTQAEISGISSVVAEYLAWMKKVPPGATPGGPKANQAVLEALETRVREVNALANTRHMEAWRQMVSMLQRVEGVGPQLGMFDAEMQRRSAETMHFFQSTYDVCTPLPDQISR